MALCASRYFEGVHGEKGKEGELFGIKNIFKLHEDTLATKMAVSPLSFPSRGTKVLRRIGLINVIVDRKGYHDGSGLGPGEYGWKTEETDEGCVLGVGQGG